MAKPDEKPQDYKGPRTPIITKNVCGFCNAGDHELCRHELPYYEKLWICPCECNKNWKPIDLGTEVNPKRRKSNDAGRKHEDSNDEGSPTVTDPGDGELRRSDGDEAEQYRAADRQVVRGDGQSPGGDDSDVGDQDS